MHSATWMRIFGGLLGVNVGKWPLRAIPLFCRQSPTTVVQLVSNTNAGPPATCRAPRLRRSSSSKEPLLHEHSATVPSTGDSTTSSSLIAGEAPQVPTRARRTTSKRSKEKIEPQVIEPVSTALRGAVVAPVRELREAEPSAAPPKKRTRRSKATAAAAATSVSVESAAATAAALAAGAQPLVPQPRDAVAVQLIAPTSSAPAPAICSTSSAPAAAEGVLLIVDGNYLANRSYFGYGGRGLSTSGGVPTTVTYGCMKVLLAALRHVQPSALAVVFDSPGPTFRAAMSLLDPDAAAAGAGTAAAAAQLVRQGRLKWQDLADRLLNVAPILQDMRAAAEAEAAATPMSYLHPSGSFLAPVAAVPPAGTAADDDVSSLSSQSAGGSSRAAGAAGLMQVLVSALGPELSEALSLTGAAATVSVVPPYKAGRISRSSGFYSDLGNLQRLLGLMSVPPLRRPWLEADDLAGLLVQHAVQHGMSVRIVSGDRDLMQLVSDPGDVALLYPVTSLPSSSASIAKTALAPSSLSSSSSVAAAGRSRRRGVAPDFPFIEMREADVAAALGVPPTLVADYKALTGDSSDRLPGVGGIGPKTAVKLLTEYGSLAGVLHAAEKLSPKQRASLQADSPASSYTLTMARVLGSPGAPALPPGVVPDSVLQRLQLRGFEPGLVGRALEELEMGSLARGAGPGGELWEAFGGAAHGSASRQGSASAVGEAALEQDGGRSDRSDRKARWRVRAVATKRDESS